MSYQEFSAKDKSFNAILQTFFDDSIGKLKIIPQGISRMLVNLFSNAFYAVMEKKKQKTEGYEPTVFVSTKRLDKATEIRVQDNGIGIAQKNLDKVFHPFFTTKPAGQGIGLGLSLSCDIIKAHGGELKVNSKGEYTEIIVQWLQ